MRIFSYSIVTFLVNYILMEGFPHGGGGTGLGLLVTIPLIGIATLIVTVIHYYLYKTGKPTKYLQIIAIPLLVCMSYFLFITEPDNTPFDVIKRMRQTAREYNKITINDFFLENRYYNYEKIVAAKKKFNNQIFDTAYLIRINNAYNYNQAIETYGIMYYNGLPVSTNKNVNIEQVTKDTFRFREYIGKDTILFYGNTNYISEPVNKSDSFRSFGEGYSKDFTMKEASTGKRYKNECPDVDYGAYKVFYWLL